MARAADGLRGLAAEPPRDFGQGDHANFQHRFGPEPRRSAEQLAEQLHFDFVDGDHGCMSRAEMLAHIVTHGGYHRGAVGRILAQLQLAPPRDIYTRFLHQDQPQRREAS